MSGSTSVAPLAPSSPRPTSSSAPRARSSSRSLQGGSDVGIADVVARPRDDRHSSRDPKPATRAGSSSTRSPATRSASSPTRPTRRRTSRQQQVQDDLLRPDPQLEPGPGRRGRAARSTSSSARPPPVRRTRSRRSSWARRCSVAASASAKASNGLVQAGGQVATRTRSATCRFDFTEGTARRPLQGRRLHPAQRQVRPVRRRAQLLMVTRGAADRRGQEVHRLGPQQRRRRRQIVASDWVPLR